MSKYMRHHDLCPVVQIPDHGYCACIVIDTVAEDTAAAIQASIRTYAESLSGKREQSVALTCAALAVAR